LLQESEALLGESIDDPLGLRRLIQDEEVETGNIKWGVVTYYLNVVGFPLALSALFLQLLFQSKIPINTLPFISIQISKSIA